MAVVPIEDAPSHPSQQPHYCEQLMCTECGTWEVAVRPAACPLERCECSGCGKVGTLEVMTLREVKMMAAIRRLELRVETLEGRLGAVDGRSP